MKMFVRKLPNNSIGKFGRHLLSKVLSFFNDETYIKLYYYWLRMRSTIHLKKPKMLSDKFNWIKLNYRQNWMSMLVDKYEVRNYVKIKIGEKYLNEIYFIGDKLTENNFEALPEKFVLKATHASGLTYVCIDKKQTAFKSINAVVSKWLDTNYFLTRREWAYKDVKPRLIAEKYLAGSNGQVPEDYKFLCFNGKPELIEVDFNRFTKHTQSFYDINWTKLPLVYGKNPGNTYTLKKPINFDKMLEIAEKLSNGLPFARIDLYNIYGKIYFGEITLYPAGGSSIFQPIEYEYHFGEMLVLENYFKYTSLKY